MRTCVMLFYEFMNIVISCAYAIAYNNIENIKNYLHKMYRIMRKLHS